ncbi:MAG TPA: hypothetical protein VK530_11730 [Candidatus Acidoferrum sp.]|nr:hypothetical protein [Candidatus Acidoferrum sp.]
MKRLLAVLTVAATIAVIFCLKPAQISQRTEEASSEIAATQEDQPDGLVARTEVSSPESNSNTVAESAGPVLPRSKPVPLAALETHSVESYDTDVLASASLPPATALENMRVTLRQYALRFGENPVGDNSEITAALGGKNSKQVRFLNPDDGARINRTGQLVDNWGTPYFFHQLSRTEMEIQSAGPDRRMWTADDLVVK